MSASNIKYQVQNWAAEITLILNGLKIQVISHQVITGERGENYCETLLPLSNAMIRSSQEVCRSRKELLTVLIYHVTKSTYYESLSVT